MNDSDNVIKFSKRLVDFDQAFFYLFSYVYPCLQEFFYAH